MSGRPRRRPSKYIERPRVERGRDGKREREREIERGRERERERLKDADVWERGETQPVKPRKSHLGSNVFAKLATLFYCRQRPWASVPIKCIRVAGGEDLQAAALVSKVITLIFGLWNRLFETAVIIPQTPPPSGRFILTGAQLPKHKLA